MDWGALIPEPEVTEVDYGALIPKGVTYPEEVVQDTGVDWGSLIPQEAPVEPEIDYASLVPEEQPTPISPAIMPKQGKDIKGVLTATQQPIEGIGEAIGQVPERFKAGLAQFGASGKQAEAIIMNREADIQARRQAVEEAESGISALPVADDFWEKAITGAAQMAGGIIKGSVVPRLAGAGIGALGGLLVGSPGAGAAVGGKVGGVESARRWYNQGVSEIYNATVDEGVDHETSRVVALVGAAPYAAIELLQFGRLLPKALKPQMFQQAWKESIKKGVGAIMARGGMEYIARVAEESGEEGLQELVKGIATEAAKDMSENFEGTAKEKGIIKKLVGRMVDTTLESIPAMTLLGLGGSVTDTGVALNRRAKITNINQQQENLGALFGKDKVQKVAENTLKVDYGNGNGITVNFKDDLLDEARKSPKSFINNIKNQGRAGLRAVMEARREHPGDLKGQVDFLSKEWLPQGDTVADTEISASDGSTTTVGAIINLENGWSTRGAANHEIWHALKMVADVTPQEEAELVRVLGADEEAQAYAFERYADRHPVLKKVDNFVNYLLGGFKKSGETDEQVAIRIRDEIAARSEQEPAPVDEAIASEVDAVMAPPQQVGRQITEQITEEPIVPEVGTQTQEAQDAVQVREAEAIPVAEEAGIGEEVDEEVREQAEEEEGQVLAVKKPYDKMRDLAFAEQIALDTFNRPWHLLSLDEMDTVKKIISKTEPKPQTKSQRAQARIDAKDTPAVTPLKTLQQGQTVRFNGKAYNITRVFEQTEAEAENGEQYYEVRPVGEKSPLASEVVEAADLETKEPTLRMFDKKALRQMATKEKIAWQKSWTKADLVRQIEDKQKRKEAGLDVKFSVEQINKERFSLLDAMAKFDRDELGFKELTGVWGKVMDFFSKWFMFGGARIRGGRKLYTGGLERFLAIQTATERSVARVRNALKEAGIDPNKVWSSIEKIEEVTFALEEKDGRNNLPPEQRKLYDVLKEMRDANLDMLIEADILDKGWLENHKARLDEEIAKKEAKGESVVDLKAELKDVTEMQDALDKRSDLTKNDSVVSKALEAKKRELEKKLRDERIDQEERDSLLKQREALEKFEGYVSHVIVYRAIVEKLKAAKNTKERGRVTRGLNTFFKARTGVLTLREYTQPWTDSKGNEHEALLKREDLNPLKLMMQMTADTLVRIEMKGFIDMLKAEGLIIPEAQQQVTLPGGGVMKLDEMGIQWESIGSIQGIDKRGLTGLKVHPVAARMLRELGQSDNKLGRTWFDKLLAVTKIGQFMNPAIIWSYNPIQAVIGGVNMVRWLAYGPQAWQEVIGQGEMWEIASRTGAFQNPGLATQATNDQVIDAAVQQMQKDVSTKVKIVGKAFSTKVQPVSKYLDDLRESQDKGKDVGKLVTDALVAPYRAIGNLTWLGDNVQRMATFLTLKKEYGDIKTDEEIGQWVADIHGAYGKTSAAYRRIGGRIFFVHTFRLLMPQRIFKGFTDFPRMLLENTIQKDTYNAKELRAAAQAMVGTVGIPIATYMLMSANGWEPDDEGLPDWWKAMKAKIPIGLPFPTLMNHWKFKKNIVTPDGRQKEVVAGINNIVNMPVKWIERSTKDRPEKLDDLTYHVANLFKWEINPLYRIMLDVVENEASIGEKPPVDRSKPIYSQIAQASAYMFGNALRIYGGVIRPDTTTAQKRQVRAELDKSLNIAEKVLLGYYTGYTKNAFVPLQAGYTYTRPERRQRLGFAISSLERSISQEKNNVKKIYKDRPAQMAERLRDLNAIQRERKIRLRKIFLGEQI